VERVRDAGAEKLFLVDDASTDGSRELLEKIAGGMKGFLSVQYKKKNEGASKAVIEAYAGALEYMQGRKGADCIIVRMDSDLEQEPEWIPELFGALKKADLAVGLVARPLKARFFDWVYNRWYGFLQGRMFTGRRWALQSPGLMAFRIGLLKQMLPKLREYQKMYLREYGEKDRVGVDVALLAHARAAGKKMVVVEFRLEEVLPERHSLAKIWAQGREIKRHMRLAKKIIESGSRRGGT
jgi:glycosyltransferase involved in cell wall biosynthesis